VSDLSHIPDEAVTAAARAQCGQWYDDLDDTARDQVHADMRVTLAAALPVLNTAKDSETRDAIADELNMFASSFAEGRDALIASGCPSEAAILGGCAKALRARAASLRGKQ
jgi:type IV pilus biogenesis protein CpaD/CtpE